MSICVNFKFVSLPKYIKSNLVVLAPTGSGKTTAIIKNLPFYIKQFSRIILCFPTKRLMYEVSEKLSLHKIKHLLDNSDARLTKNISPTDWLTNNVIVTSYEKADSMTLMYPEIAKNSLIVIDEVHLAAGKDPDSTDRAVAILSLMATAKQYNAKVITLSATIPNAQELAEYLNGEFIEHKVDRNIDVSFVEIGHVPWGSKKYLMAIISKILDIVKDGKQTIIFRISRKDCEEIAKVLNANGFSAAVVHAGLPKDEQDTVMKAFRNKDIQIIVSTHSLTWGVNTPAEKIVIAGILRYTRTGPEINKFIKTTDIAQMAGRAGRPGYSNVAELVTIITTPDKMFIYSPDSQYYTEKEFVERSLNSSYIEEIGLRTDLDTVLLRLVMVGRIKSVNDVKIIPETWFNVPPLEKFEDALDKLSLLGLVVIDNTDNIRITKLGKIVAEMYMDIKTFTLIDEYILSSVAQNSTRIEKLSATAKVAGLIKGNVELNDNGLNDNVVLSMSDELSAKVLSHLVLVKPTGDTNLLAESIKRIAFFMSKLAVKFNYPKDDTNDWYLFGKTMKMIRSMIYNKVPITGVLGQYVDGKIDKFFDLMTKNKSKSQNNVNEVVQ